MIALLFTGGTISMRHDATAGGAIPKLSAREIVAATRGIEDIADLEIEDWGAFPGPHMTMERMWALRNRIVELVARADVQGVVLTHGTDTLEESAYLCARSIDTDKPIVFTGAMRTASDLGWDGPANLMDAARVAASEAAHGRGVMVVVGGQVYAGIDVTKGHTHALESFESPGLGPLGVVDEARVIFQRALPPPQPRLHPTQLALPIDIVAVFAGSDARLLDGCRPTSRGLVVAAMGRGNVPPTTADGIRRWRDEGKPVVIAARALRGRVGPTYAYEGGGRRLMDLGAFFAGSRRPQQARIDLALALGLGFSTRELTVLFAS